MYLIDTLYDKALVADLDVMSKKILENNSRKLFTNHLEKEDFEALIGNMKYIMITLEYMFYDNKYISDTQKSLETLYNDIMLI